MKRDFEVSLGRGTTKVPDIAQQISRLPTEIQELVVFLDEAQRRAYLDATPAHQVELLNFARERRVQMTRR